MFFSFFARNMDPKRLGLTASATEHVVTLLPTKVLRVTVVDDASGEPMERATARDFYYFADRKRFETFPPGQPMSDVVSHGKFELRSSWPAETIQKAQLVLAAKGYAPLLSPEWNFRDRRTCWLSE